MRGENQTIGRQGVSKENQSTFGLIYFNFCVGKECSRGVRRTFAFLPGVVKSHVLKEADSF